MQANMFQLTGVDQCIRVHGLEGAKAYAMGANCRVPLFDDNEDLLYVKRTDENGFPSIRVFELTERVTIDSNNANQGIALNDIRALIREELNFMKEEILNAQQPISEPAINDTNAVQSNEYDRSAATTAKRHNANSRSKQRANTSNVEDDEE